jgi:carboxylesterase type B
MLEAGITMKPHHDNYFLDDYPLAMIKAGNFNKVPFMAGFTRDEYGAAIILLPKVFFGRSARYEEILAKVLNLPEDEAKRLAGLYPLDEYNGKVRNAYWQIIVDSFLGCPTTSGLAAASEKNPDTYFYRFDYDGMRFGNVIGVFHSFEVPFVFNSFDRPPVASLYNKKNIQEAQALSRVVQGYWLNFAKTGDPNGPGLPPWPKYSPDQKNVQLIDVNTTTAEVDWMDRCEFWEDYSRYMPLPFVGLELEE